MCGIRILICYKRNSNLLQNYYLTDVGNRLLHYDHGKACVETGSAYADLEREEEKDCPDCVRILQY